MAFGDNWEQMANRGADQYSDEWRKSKKDKRIEELERQVNMLTAEVKALREENRLLHDGIRTMREAQREYAR